MECPRLTDLLAESFVAVVVVVLVEAELAAEAADNHLAVEAARSFVAAEEHSLAVVVDSLAVEAARSFAEAADNHLAAGLAGFDSWTGKS